MIFPFCPSSSGANHARSTAVEFSKYSFT
jgi:hypothetical protein